MLRLRLDPRGESSGGRAVRSGVVYSIERVEPTVDCTKTHFALLDVSANIEAQSHTLKTVQRNRKLVKMLGERIIISDLEYYGVVKKQRGSRMQWCKRWHRINLTDDDDIL